MRFKELRLTIAPAYGAAASLLADLSDLNCGLLRFKDYPLTVKGIIGPFVVHQPEIGPYHPEGFAIFCDPLRRDLRLVGARIRIAVGRPGSILVHLGPRSPRLRRSIEAQVAWLAEP